MKLYHGTSSRFLNGITRDGIKPRGRKKGNWGHTVHSADNAVYLTNCYAPYFALNAIRGDDERMLIVEINTNLLNPWSLAPDEDTMAQSQPKNAPLHGPQGTLIERSKYFRERLHQYTGDGQWIASLNAMGNCAYLDTIPVKAITRMAIVDTDRAPILGAMSLDPTISIINYKIVGNKYRGITKWIFGDDLGEDAPMQRLSDEELAAWSSMSGITRKEIVESMKFDYRLPPESEREAISILGGTLVVA